MKRWLPWVWNGLFGLTTIGCFVLAFICRARLDYAAPLLLVGLVFMVITTIAIENTR